MTRLESGLRNYEIAATDFITNCGESRLDQVAQVLENVERIMRSEGKGPRATSIAAIIATKNSGNYFIKFYGPERTVTEHEGAFTKMIEGREENT